MLKLMVVHVGTDKTGSTALQTMAAGNADALRQNGVVYLEEGRGQGINHARVYEQTRAGDFSSWYRLADELRASACPQGLVSFEGFYHFDGDQLGRIREALTGVRVHVVIYLRRQSDMVRSGVAQLVKQGTMKVPLGELSSVQLADIGSSYAPVLARFSSIFGRGNVCVRRYEASRWPEQNLFLDFLGAIGVSINGRELSERFRLPVRDPNPTLDCEAIHLLDAMDSLGIERDRRLVVVRLLLSRSGGEKSTFVSDELAERVDAYFEASNRAIAEEWFGERALFSEPSSFLWRAPDPSRVAEYFNFLLRWLPLLEIPVWRGGCIGPRALEASGALRVGLGWTQRAKVLRLERGSGSLTFRVACSDGVDIVLELRGRWCGAPGRLSITVNEVLLLREGEDPSPKLTIPGWLHWCGGGGLSSSFALRRLPAARIRSSNFACWASPAEVRVCDPLRG